MRAVWLEDKALRLAAYGGAASEAEMRSAFRRIDNLADGTPTPRFFN